MKRYGGDKTNIGEEILSICQELEPEAIRFPISVAISAGISSAPDIAVQLTFRERFKEWDEVQGHIGKLSEARILKGEAAEQVYLKTIDEIKKIVGPDDIDVARVYFMLGIHRFSEKNIRGAIEALEEATEVALLFGNKNVATFIMKFNLAGALASHGWRKEPTMSYKELAKGSPSKEFSKAIQEGLNELEKTCDGCKSLKTEMDGLEGVLVPTEKPYRYGTHHVHGSLICTLVIARKDWSPSGRHEKLKQKNIEEHSKIGLYVLEKEDYESLQGPPVSVNKRSPLDQLSDIWTSLEDSIRSGAQGAGVGTSSSKDDPQDGTAGA